MIPTDTEVKRKNETAEEEVQPGDTEVVPPPHRILRFPPLPPLPEGQQQEYRSVKSKDEADQAKAAELKEKEELELAMAISASLAAQTGQHNIQKQP